MINWFYNLTSVKINVFKTRCIVFHLIQLSVGAAIAISFVYRCFQISEYLFGVGPFSVLGKVIFSSFEKEFTDIQLHVSLNILNYITPS